MRPHICKEVMISLRAEVYPTTKIDNVEVTIFKTLDVSIFPGANYDLKLQVTRNLSDFLHKYFSLESVENDAGLETASLPDTGSDSTTRRHSRTIDSIESSGGSENSSGPKQKRKSLVSFIKKKTFVRRFTQGDISADGQKSLKPISSWSFGSRQSTSSSSTPDNNSSSGNTMSGNSRERSSIKNGLSATTPQAAGSNESKGSKQKCNKQEGLYIKYMRVGDINVDVSTLGFAINLDKFKAVMEPFFCRGEVLTWTRLIWSFERHLVWSLTKHTATTGLNKIGEFLRINNKAQTMQLLLKDDKMDPEQMLAVKRAMLLGSPDAKNAPNRARALAITTPSTSAKSPTPTVAQVKSPTTPLPAVRSPSVSPKGSLSINLFQREKRQEAVNELKGEEEKEKGVKDKSRENMTSLLGRSV
ncbi:hypothetical protein EON65_34555 [archaeon]|nr:MAG: hypothetical protein EON65_34555 [archaeon]